MTTKIINKRQAGPDNQVLTVEGGNGKWRKTPCGGCPWKKINDGSFPPEAFCHSAETAYDMAQTQFSCHESGSKKPATCAGFLLNGSEHNLSVRLAIMNGRNPDDVSDGGFDLHENYKSMAVANGVSPNDEALKRCR